VFVKAFGRAHTFWGWTDYIDTRGLEVEVVLIDKSYGTALQLKRNFQKKISLFFCLFFLKGK